MPTCSILFATTGYLTESVFFDRSSSIGVVGMGAGRVGCVFVSAVRLERMFSFKKIEFSRFRLGPIALASQSILLTSSSIIFQGVLSLTGATTIRSVRMFLLTFDACSHAVFDSIVSVICWGRRRLRELVSRCVYR